MQNTIAMVSRERRITLVRDPKIGFGFVAGSEKPVVVRFICEGGPSSGFLEPGDQITYINDENVRQAPRDHVINLIKSANESVNLRVSQTVNKTADLKSSLMTPSKRTKLKNRPCHVRFTTDCNDPTIYPLVNILKVHFENGQTKSFSYDTTTTVQDVLESMKEKLRVVNINPFALIEEFEQAIGKKSSYILDPQQTLRQVRSAEKSKKKKYILRVVFFPSNPISLLQEDPGIFEYLYRQCYNDVIQDKFAPEIQPEVAFKLGALQMYIQFHSDFKKKQKLALKSLEKDINVELLLPKNMAESMKKKEIWKLLSFFMNNLLDQMIIEKEIIPSSDTAKVEYLKIVQELPSYGTRCYSARNKENVFFIVMIHPKFGICKVNEGTRHPETLALDIEECSFQDFLLVVTGYYRLLKNIDLHQCSTKACTDSALISSPKLTNMVRKQNQEFDIQQKASLQLPMDGRRLELTHQGSIQRLTSPKTMVVNYRPMRSELEANARGINKSEHSGAPKSVVCEKCSGPDQEEERRRAEGKPIQTNSQPIPDSSYESSRGSIASSHYADNLPPTAQVGQDNQLNDHISNGMDDSSSEAKKLQSYEDFNKFITDMIIPPPPSTDINYISQTCMADDQKFIIPSPPCVPRSEEMKMGLERMK
eukprot:maker-scaffold707_size108565-snap-gene-0.14 protein:Tk02058 transcript:maker-scaffold707_size108565-snap-gene-0.14-mRNA-1 annotation:"AGAP003128-PA"